MTIVTNNNYSYEKILQNFLGKIEKLIYYQKKTIFNYRSKLLFFKIFISNLQLLSVLVL
jgi:hypothetical protein